MARGGSIERRAGRLGRRSDHDFGRPSNGRGRRHRNGQRIWARAVFVGTEVAPLLEPPMNMALAARCPVVARMGDGRGLIGQIGSTGGGASRNETRLRIEAHAQQVFATRAGSRRAASQGPGSRRRGKSAPAGATIVSVRAGLQQGSAALRTHRSRAGARSRRGRALLHARRPAKSARSRAKAAATLSRTIRMRLRSDRSGEVTRKTSLFAVTSGVIRRSDGSLAAMKQGKVPPSRRATSRPCPRAARRGRLASAETCAARCPPLRAADRARP